MSQDEFTLIGSDANFIARQRNTFLALSELEKKANRQDQDPMEVDDQLEGRRPKIPKSQTKVFRGKESIFKTPQDPVPRNFLKKLPDFKKNPHKWTKYSLEDVKDEDISDKANTKAALSFLKDLETRNKAVEKDSDEAKDQKIIFRRPTSTSVSKQETEDKPSFKSSKIIMPEYVVGQKIKKDRKTKSMKSNKADKNLKLDHLYQEDQDE
ncbi:protein TSSC4 [Coccinella septempunctata]|uniref:protein TSSC4 n=1 Tax=Coccinella septempunctata TaxID=41139 RepID=UPI001D05CDDA|nr:protein TSSC4 [Coccinella septempunctata]